jgi:hypothetical protein
MTKVEEAFGIMAILGLGGRWGRTFAIPSWTEEMGSKKNFLITGGEMPSE